MDLWLVVVLYLAGLGMVVAEAMMPGVVMGLVGAGALVTSIVFGFRHHWALGSGQILLAVLVAPAAFYLGVRRLQLRSTLAGGVSFSEDYAPYLGKEGESHTELRPAGIVLIEGKKVDVVTAGEMVDKGKRVRVVKVEGNRVVVRAL
jgi:membrane-bound serine protease (ClpP class)